MKGKTTKKSRGKRGRKEREMEVKNKGHELIVMRHWQTSRSIIHREKSWSPSLRELGESKPFRQASKRASKDILYDNCHPHLLIKRYKISPQKFKASLEKSKEWICTLATVKHQRESEFLISVSNTHSKISICAQKEINLKEKNRQQKEFVPRLL